ncbi:DUF4157 domain-containing protein [Nostoc punctiforme]|uniref:eCIS core domain-containing protein n=1 Tax=Nostoc punctiforme (strain ATCC 29133 / PCC 73102) TaxID=63737 RepID=B2IW87_NOSP7|nr:DUF4157 domain-containing protein [Nostoc punctiforme]ACC79832.1 hypothetical protein Npun_F1106 [Nostoc punctiforme PCC 73102]
MREHISRQKKTTTGFSIPSLKHPIRGFGLESSAISRQAIPEIQPLHKPVTHDISRIPLRTQAKLSISQPGDIYEQEADSVAQQVMQSMAQPVNHQSIQREALPEEEEELQMKSLDNSTLQREALPEDEEELQMKPMVQRQAGMGATPDLETSINQARGGGVAIADNIREPMEQAFGADFSGVKVHTDSKSDQLNQSIQARAFTTGQDVFFRQGEYNPGSQGGQELLAHELTHVVQQNGGMVQKATRGKLHENHIRQGSKVVQRALDGTQVSGIHKESYGLVSVDWNAATNEAGAHVRPAGQGEHLNKADMLAAVNDIYQALHTREQNGRIKGYVQVDPQGAAVVKSVVELLGAALGSTWGVLQAKGLTVWRKSFSSVNKNKSGVIAPEIVSEHIAWLKALESRGVFILPIGLNEPGLTADDFMESMVSGSDIGKQRLAAYESWINQGNEVGLIIRLDLAQLGNVRNVLQG